MKSLWLSIRSLKNLKYVEFWHGDVDPIGVIVDLQLAKNSPRRYEYCALGVRTLDRIYCRNSATDQHTFDRPNDFGSWSIE
jgi:hypothetical protein